MDIRELKRPPILDDPDTYDALLAHAERSLGSTPVVARPRNVAILALLQMAETMVGMANARHMREMVALAVSGARPHAFPVYQAAVEAQLYALRPVLRAIDLAARPDLLPLAVGEVELKEAGAALFVGARERHLLDSSGARDPGSRQTSCPRALSGRSPCQTLLASAAADARCCWHGSALEAELRRLGVSDKALIDLETALKADKAAGTKKVLGEGAKAWIGQMAVHAADGTWQAAGNGIQMITESIDASSRFRLTGCRIGWCRRGGRQHFG